MFEKCISLCDTYARSHEGKATPVNEPINGGGINMATSLKTGQTQKYAVFLLKMTASPHGGEINIVSSFKDGQSQRCEVYQMYAC